MHLIYFSPTGGTKKVATIISTELAKYNNEKIYEIDFTDNFSRKKSYQFNRDDTVILAFPTYAGKLPNKILPDIKENLHANLAKTLAIVSFGNRSFDNSLKELAEILTLNGYDVRAAGAFVSRHPFSERLGKNRPNEDDLSLMDKLIKGFLNNEKSVLSKIPGDASANYYTPLKEDGSPAKFLKATPITNKEKCVNCKTCARICPMEVIDRDNVSITTGPCIKCHGCIYICKQRARSFNDEELSSHIRMLEANYQEPKKSRIFI